MHEIFIGGLETFIGFQEISLTGVGVFLGIIIGVLPGIGPLPEISPPGGCFAQMVRLAGACPEPSTGSGSR